MNGFNEPPTAEERRAIEVLQECADLMRRKGAVYNRSGVRQAEYYPNGVRDLWTLLHQKMTRVKSILSEDGSNDFESLSDTFMDIINYSAFAVEFLEGKMDGQTEKPEQ